jgi:hypothetical protein
LSRLPVTSIGLADAPIQTDLRIVCDRYHAPGNGFGELAFTVFCEFRIMFRFEVVMSGSTSAPIFRSKIYCAAAASACRSSLLEQLVALRNL